AVSPAVTVGVWGGRGRARARRGAGDRGQAGGGHEEVLHALAGHLAGVVAGKGVQQVAVVGDLVAVGVVDHGELAACPGGGGRGGGGGGGGRGGPPPPVTSDVVAVSGR